MTDRPVRHSDLRKTGLIVALGVGLLIVAALGLVVLTHQKPPANTVTKPEPVTPAPNPDNDLRNIGMKADKATVQFIDSKDPNRTAGMMKWKKLEPKAEGISELTSPEGYIYLRDGGLVIISANTGLIRTPPRQSQPESGEFEGDVQLRVFGPRANGAPPDPSVDRPMVTATTELLLFQISEGEITVPKVFHIRSARVDFDGSSLLLRINQVEESIQLLEVAHVEKLIIRPDADQPSVPSARQVAGENGVKVPGDHAVRKRNFRATVEQNVHIAQGLRTMDAERVEAWATLINNQLPDGAIARLGPDPVPGSPAAPGGKNLSSPADHEQIEATWKGGLVIRPVEQFPTDFADNAFALRLLAGAQGPVHVEDDNLLLDATAPQVDYAATTRQLMLRGSQPQPITINTPTIGTMNCNNAVIGLATGKAQLTGPGSIAPAKPIVASMPKIDTGPGTPSPNTPPTANQPAAAKAPLTTLAFTDHLDLQFAAPRNWIEPTVLSANIRGGLVATTGDIVAKGDDADVEFEPPPPGPAPAGKRTPIKKITLRGHAEASSPGEPLTAGGPPTRETITGREMIVNFYTDPKTGREEPAAIHVKGDAVAQGRGYTIKADTMEAQLHHDEHGTLYVKTAEANGHAKATDAKGLSASADRILSEPRGGDDHAGLLTLTGKPVTVYRDGTTMTGPTIRLAAATGELNVDGIGSIDSLRDDPKNHSTTAIKATWTKYMRFNNTTGRAECVGDTLTTMEVGEDERDTLKAERVILDFPPAAAVKPDAPRDLISAEAKGGADGPAKLEHRRFVNVNGEKKTERLVYLEGPSVIADQIKRTLLVPGAGKLLVDDRRALASVNDQPGVIANIGDVGNSRGTSLFTWADHLSMSLPESTLEMHRDVKLTHQPAGSVPGQRPVMLECQELQAWLQTNQKTEVKNVDSLDATLTKVEARGGTPGSGASVHAQSDGKDLYCNRLTFDAANALLEASGGTGGDDEMVTLQDPTRTAPLRARQIIWNQKLGEFRLIDPAPATIGR